MSRRPLIAVVSCTRAMDTGRMQGVSERFLTPIVQWSELNPVIVPSLGDAAQARSLAASFDAVLLTGCMSNVAPARYGSGAPQVEPSDVRRDATALAFASALIGSGGTVFGICRGLQEINVLYGGTLHGNVGEAGYDAPSHHPAGTRYGDALAGNLHPVHIRNGVLGRERTLDVVSAHHQGIDRLGSGLVVEATASDGLVESVSDFGDAAVLGVQWHPEWNVDSCQTSREFFRMLGRAARGDREGCLLAQAA